MKKLANKTILPELRLERRRGTPRCLVWAYVPEGTIFLTGTIGIVVDYLRKHYGMVHYQCLLESRHRKVKSWG